MGHADRAGNLGAEHRLSLDADEPRAVPPRSAACPQEEGRT
jgi:hypothetical protein